MRPTPGVKKSWLKETIISRMPKTSKLKFLPRKSWSTSLLRSWRSLKRKRNHSKKPLSNLRSSTKRERMKFSGLWWTKSTSSNLNSRDSRQVIPQTASLTNKKWSKLQKKGTSLRKNLKQLLRRTGTNKNKTKGTWRTCSTLTLSKPKCKLETKRWFSKFKRPKTCWTTR